MKVERVSRAKGRELLARQAKRHKYHAQPTTVFGQRFDSKREASVYATLVGQSWSGEITDLELQPEYELHAPNGEVLGKYVADFRYRRHGKQFAVDVKGFKTPMYRWKKKHVQAEYGIQITEVR